MRRALTSIPALTLLAALAGPAVARAGVESLRAAPVAGLSFDERVACHRAIAQVYWRHRVWPAANRRPKPAFEATPAAGALVVEAEDSLLRSRALESLWRQSITPAMLQAELDRIARDTRRPQVLREIYDALDHDPERLAECLARPLLAERLLRNRYATDDRLHDSLRQTAAAELVGVERPEQLESLSGERRELAVERDRGADPGAPDPFAGLSDEAGERTAERTWNATNAWLAGLFGESRPDLAARAPAVRPEVSRLPTREVSALTESDRSVYVASVLSASAERLEVVVVEWPKRPYERWWREVRETLGPPAATPDSEYRLRALAGGACADDTWRPTVSPVLGTRWGTSVWTGSEMLVWGGFYFPADRGNYGGRYDPATDTWRLIGTWNAPTSRGRHTAVWTGSEMIVWGGEEEGLVPSNSGGRYDPSTDTWTPTSLTGAPQARTFHSGVWTGSELIVWGGCVDYLCDVYPATGGRYDPALDQWTPVATGSAPVGRYLHTAVWTGSEMIVWGGWTASGVTSTGGRYDPATDDWTATSTSGAPDARFTQTAVWTADRMVVWGGRAGEFSSIYFATGGRYDPVADTWSPTTMVGAPSARDGHRAIWTGSEMILFGGYDGSTAVASGARYDPVLDQWSPTALLDAPAARVLPTLVWTGTEMIAWAGIGETAAELADGARYSPATDSWTPIGLPATPTERSYHTHVWTGTEVVVWGGCGIFSTDLCPTETGGRYDLVTDSWTPTSTVGAPLRREFQNAVWTGTEMLVWGGCADVYCFERLRSGGRYDPATDSWAPMSEVGAPLKRYWHDGVWTGTEMIVWGGCTNKDCTDVSGPGLPRDGGRYDPASDTWTPTNETDAPGGRWFTSTTWTGSEMIVWGGQDMDVGNLDNGARYDPATDSWTPTSTAGAPTPRIRHRAHWTGDRLLVWGGDDFDGNFYVVGGLYDPATDSWSATTPAGAPSARSYPYTAWTGSELVVWGGLPPDPGGGLYDPVADGWRPMTPIEAPTPRADLYTGAWTGAEMVLFGGTFPDTLMEAATGGVYCVRGSTLFRDGFELGGLGAWSTTSP